MRYALFSAQFEPHVGGVETFTKGVAVELVREGHDVLVATSAFEDAPAHEVLESGVEVVRLPSWRFVGDRLPISRKNAEYRRCWQRIKDWAPDRVVVNTRFYEHSIQGLSLARELDVPALMIEHGASYLSFGTPLLDPAVMVYEKFYTARVKARRPRYGGVSSRALAWLGNFGISGGTLVPQAIDAKAYRAKASDRDFRAETGAGGLLVAVVTRMIPEKHPLEVVEVAKSLPSVTFALAGEGPLFEQVVEVAKDVPNVHLLGQLASSDVSALFRDADLSLLPTDSEGGPMTLLEAGAWGTPTAITDVGHVRDLFGDTGFVRFLDAPAAPAMVEVLSAFADVDAQARATERAELRAYVEEHFTWAQTAAAIERAFA